MRTLSALCSKAIDGLGVEASQAGLPGCGPGLLHGRTQPFVSMPVATEEHGAHKNRQKPAQYWWHAHSLNTELNNSYAEQADNEGLDSIERGAVVTRIRLEMPEYRECDSEDDERHSYAQMPVVDRADLFHLALQVLVEPSNPTSLASTTSFFVACSVTVTLHSRL